MKIKGLHLICSALLMSAFVQPAHADFVIKDGWIVNADEVATFTAEEHYWLACAAYNRKEWKEAAKQFRIVSSNFSSTPLGQDSYFYLGIAYFELEEYEFANDALSTYLSCHANPQYFEEVMEYKFEIANRFKNGAKRHFFGVKQLPMWASGHSHAVEIYDEVIAAVPCHELAAWSIFAKADMHRSDHQYRESIDMYQLLIRRFPKHELAPESYLLISKIYVEQSAYELQNPDLLAFAQINVRRFAQDFPKDERLATAEADVQCLKETYANALYETGQFYERIRKPAASAIYYHNAIEQFPDTAIAQLCRQRLSTIRVPLALPEVTKEADQPISPDDTQQVDSTPSIS